MPMPDEFPYRIFFKDRDDTPVECGAKDAESAFQVFKGLIGRGYAVAIFYGLQNVSDKFVDVVSFTDKGDSDRA